MVFFTRRQRPALARVARNSNAARFDAGCDDPVDPALEDIIRQIRAIPPSARERLTGSPTVYAR